MGGKTEVERQKRTKQADKRLLSELHNDFSNEFGYHASWTDHGPCACSNFGFLGMSPFVLSTDIISNKIHIYTYASMYRGSASTIIDIRSV